MVYLISIALVRKERYYLLPSVPTRGHGIVLLIFWTTTFMAENLTLVNLKQSEYWFRLKT